MEKAQLQDTLQAALESVQKATCPCVFGRVAGKCEGHVTLCFREYDRSGSPGEPRSPLVRSQMGDSPRLWQAVEKYGSIEAYYDSCEISCKVAKEKEAGQCFFS